MSIDRTGIINAAPPRQGPIIILTPRGDGSYQITKLILSPQTYDMAILTQLCKLATTNHQLSLALKMRRLTFGSAKIHRFQDIEKQTLPRHHVYKIEKDELVTNMIRNTTVLLPRAGSFRENLLRTPAMEEDRNFCVWCFYYEVDDFVSCAWIVVAIVLAMLIGLIVGFAKSDGKLGFSVGTGLFSLFTTLHKLFMKLSKSRCN